MEEHMHIAAAVAPIAIPIFAPVVRAVGGGFEGGGAVELEEVPVVDGVDGAVAEGREVVVDAGEVDVVALAVEFVEVDVAEEADEVAEVDVVDEVVAVEDKDEADDDEELEAILLFVLSTIWNTGLETWYCR